MRESRILKKEMKVNYSFDFNVWWEDEGYAKFFGGTSLISNTTPNAFKETVKEICYAGWKAKERQEDL